MSIIGRKPVAAATAGVLALALGLAAWTYWPLYQFMAHRGEAPFGPFGWVELPDGDAPRAHEVLDPTYRDAGEDALRRLAAWRSRIGAPSLSAAVVIDGELVWRGVSGWSDLAEQAPTDFDTVYRIGSTSKAVTATALARLVDRGLIDLDAPISTYINNLPNPAWADMTARQLAAHMSGLPHYRRNTDEPGQRRTLTLDHYYADVRDSLDVFDGSDLLFEPGDGFHYSTLGTVLLGAVMSEAAGMPYRELVRREVLDPLELTATRVATPEPEGTMAQFYLRRDERYRTWRRVDLSHRLPGGGWASTPTEMARLGAQWLDTAYISDETRNAFWTPQSLNNGEVNEQNYAIGWRWREWEVDGVGIARNANHGGVSRGSQSWLLVFPDQNMVIAFSTNMNTESFSDFGMVYRELLQAFAAN